MRPVQAYFCLEFVPLQHIIERIMWIPYCEVFILVTTWSMKFSSIYSAMQGLDIMMAIHRARVVTIVCRKLALPYI